MTKILENNIAEIIMIMLIIIVLSSCASNRYYKGCDGKSKFRTEMN